MLVLGLLLIAAAAVVTVGALYDGGETATVEILGRSYETTVAGVFVVGAITALVFMIGVWALLSGMGRSRRKRAERKEAKARQHDSVKTLEEERAELRAENERLSEKLAERPSATGSGATAVGAGGAATAAGSSADDHAAHDTYGSHDTHDTHGRHESDRVVDHNTDLNGPEHTTSSRSYGRHGENI
jgi:ABC-type nickel/cobalt efflux system permease component RcnA